MYTIEEIKELINTLDNSSLTNLEIKGENGEKLVLNKESKKEITVAPALQSVIPQAAAPAPQAVAAVEPTPAAAPAETKPAEDNYRVITSPMVGVFYTSPSPEADAYVSVGQTVKNGDIVCIIEAMKLMNEIPSTESGTIAEVCVSNGDIVEYGQPLFKIK
ncbi:MAG: acetyl-CoA carboxylase biotin carboxyl carrier protein [Acutalibacteraceae bacterium]